MLSDERARETKSVDHRVDMGRGKGKGRVMDGNGEWWLQQFVLAEVHSLNDVTTIIENPSDILRINCARQMGIAVMPTVITVRCHFLN